MNFIKKYENWLLKCPISHNLMLSLRKLVIFRGVEHFYFVNQYIQIRRLIRRLKHKCLLNILISQFQ